ncbi:MAG: hypothetical protein ACE364_00820 [Chlorobiota bacterium]
MKILSILFITLLFFSCKEENSTVPNENRYFDSGKTALVMVIENSDRANEQIEDLAFETYPTETLSILSDIFAVPYDSLYGKDLNKILDQYGEPWQIENIMENAGSYYDEIVVLTDSTATKNKLKEELKRLSEQSFNIDMVFSLHGSTTNIVFEDASVPVDDLTKELEELDIPIRVLYQTNCKSANIISYWDRLGLAGCNGTVENNYLTIFAPANFVKHWVSGKSYYECVENTYNDEIAALKSYNDILPVLDYITQGNYLAGSLPIYSGIDLGITKDNYIVSDKPVNTP